ncbi:hypothetical protein PTI98_000031 [Pleurotus ostreatus]|nr:hypothetical protein PTI98_000031 [Pleurotus ostreatus]
MRSCSRFPVYGMDMHAARVDADENPQTHRGKRKRKSKQRKRKRKGKRKGSTHLTSPHLTSSLHPCAPCTLSPPHFTSSQLVPAQADQQISKSADGPLQFPDSLMYVRPRRARTRWRRRCGEIV